MTTPLDLTQTVTQYLTRDNVESLFGQMGVRLCEHHLLPNAYQARVQVITWALLEKLKASHSFPESRLTEDNVKPIVDSTIKHMGIIIPPDEGFPDAPSGFMSRSIWYTMKFLGQELQF